MAFKSERQLVEAIEQYQLNKIIYLVERGYNIHVQNTLGQNLLIHILQQQQDSLSSKKRFHLFQFLITNYNLDIHSFDYNHKNVLLEQGNKQILEQYKNEIREQSHQYF
ncbi:unnamed protein product [Rotaria sp. Silwood1]|nr:unnamed protein product [Rotaria sp. Silwood1]